MSVETVNFIREEIDNVAADQPVAFSALCLFAGIEGLGCGIYEALQSPVGDRVSSALFITFGSLALASARSTYNKYLASPKPVPLDIEQ